MSKPTTPSLGQQVRVEQIGREVHVIFVAKSIWLSDDLCFELLRQLRAGSLHVAVDPQGVPEIWR